MDQVVEVADLAIGVGQDREVDDCVLRFVDVANPLVVRVYRVNRQRDGLDATLGKLILELGGEAQFSGAHRREVSRVRKQNAPAVAQPIVKLDGASAGILFEIGGDIAKS